MSPQNFTAIVEGESYLSEVVRQGRPFRQSRFTENGLKVKTGLFARAILCVPLKLRGVVIGVLAVSNQLALRSFSKRDEFLLSFLADYAAIALENARVFQAADKALTRKLDELRTLIQITQTITSTLDLDEVLQLAIKQIHDGWDVEVASLWWLDRARQSLVVLAKIGAAPARSAAEELPLGQGFAGTVAQTGNWIYSNDVSHHPLYAPSAENLLGPETQSILCVPLIYRGQVVGALELINKRDGDFDDQDVERAASIAAAVAIATANAMSFDEIDAR